MARNCIFYIETRLYIPNALEKKNRLQGNISLEEINLLRPGVIITFNLFQNRGISSLCMYYKPILFIRIV